METIQRFLQPMSGKIDIVAVSCPVIKYITIQHICHIIQSGLTTVAKQLIAELYKV